MVRSFTITRGGETVALPYGPFVDDAGIQHSVQVLDRWSEEELATIGVAVAEADDPIPAKVPMNKVRKYLIREGLKTTVQAYLDNLPGTEGEEAREDWEYAPNLVVNSTLALGAKAALSLTDEQYAAMIRAADALA